MYKKILVPLDGSELAEGPLPFVVGLARKLNSEVILFSVCTQKACLELPLRAYLEKKAEGLLSLGIKVSQLVVEGDAVNKTLDFAQSNNIGLIAISTHTPNRISQMALESISSKAMQRLHIPVLLIQSKEQESVLTEKELQKILILLDGSKFAESIIPYVEGMADCLNEVTIYMINEPLEIPHSYNYDLLADWRNYDKDIMIKAERKVKDYLRRSESVLRDKGMKVHSAWVPRKPVQTILRYIEDNSINLIAMATCDFSCIHNWAYCSIASRIIETSLKPLLLIHPPLPTLQQEKLDGSDSLMYARLSC